ncbi:hypothetical protein GPX89_14820 [Nocardia sp. ET3-3]|uniref:Uncharacterized protein n=1 Tax=Nocardia terrae TaxID=2675851 RepID=A0A7K1UVW3_9NOCA|nr:hypothetical protein [Nocardia terrae]MVU78514.1 hypothetical protein [Nocardia terrae]
MMARSLSVQNPAPARAPEPVEPSEWGHHLGVGEDIADSLYADQLGALIFVRKLVRAGYLFNALVAIAVWVAITLWGRYSGPRSFHDCAAVPGFQSGCNPDLEAWIVGGLSGFVLAIVVFTLLSLPCFVVAYAVRWSARAMADRN